MENSTVIKSKQIANALREYLLSDMLKCWEIRTEDKEFGGYLTDFDRKWNLISSNKGCWGQGRQVYTFSYVFEELESDEKWKHLASVGAKFLTEKMYMGNGRFNYLVSRDGQVLEGPISIFSDAFALSGLAKYISVFKDNTYTDFLKNTFSIYRTNTMDDAFPDVAPFVHGKGICNHSKIMIALNTSYECYKIVGQEAMELMKYALYNEFNVLLDKDVNMIFENKSFNGKTLDIPNATLINVGHNYEALWFALECAILLKDNGVINKIISIAESLYEKCRDENGESVYSVDLFQGNSKHSTWKYEKNFKPTDKVSWSYAEEMCLWAKLFTYTKDEKYFNRFEKVLNFTNQYFIDREYGDWYHALNQDKSILYDFKGSTVKSAYHIPRALIRSIKALEEV